MEIHNSAVYNYILDPNYPVHMRRDKVIGSVVVIVDTKIAWSQHLGAWATCKRDESVEFRKKMASVSFKSIDTAHKGRK